MLTVALYLFTILWFLRRSFQWRFSWCTQEDKGWESRAGMWNYYITSPDCLSYILYWCASSCICYLEKFRTYSLEVWFCSHKESSLQCWWQVPHCWFCLEWSCPLLNVSTSHILAMSVGARGGAVGWGTAPQAGRSRVRSPMVSLEFFVDIILWHTAGRLSLWQIWVPGIFPDG